MTGKTFLDMSCNTGWFSKLAADRGAKVTGFDISWQVIDKAMDLVPTGNFYLSMAETWDFSQRFDYILCSSAFHYYYDREEIIERVSKVTNHFVLELPVIDKDEPDIQYQSNFKPNFCALPSRGLIEKWLNKYFDKVELIGYTVWDTGKIGGQRPVYKCTNNE